MAYEDLLKDTSAVAPDDNNKFIITILDLNLSTTYPIQFRWKYKDGTFGKWSTSKLLTTPGESFPDTPKFSQTDVEGGAEYIKVTWGGLNAAGNPFTNYDRVDVYISGSPFDGSKPAATFKTPGTQILKAPQGEYLVALYAVSVAGTRSAVSADFSVIVTAQGETVEPPTNPNGFTSKRILAGVEVDWAGTYANGTFTGFEAIKVYAGTSATATAGTYTEVGVLTGNNVKNVIVVPVDGTYVKYGQATYIHAAAVNKSGTIGTLQANVTNIPLGPGKATDADINDGAVVISKLASDVLTVGNLKAGDINATSYIRAGTAGSARVEISSSTVGSVLPGLTVYASDGSQLLRAPLTGGLTITGGGTFTGDLSAGSGSSKFGSDSNGIWLGSDTYSANSVFRVSRSGYLTANSGTVGGWSLTSSYMQNGTGTFKISSADSAVYVGDSAGAHIRISASGGIATYNGGSQVSGFNLSTSGTLTLSGTITATTGYLGDPASTSSWTIGSTGIVSGGSALIDMGISGSKIKMGNYTLYSDSDGFKIYDSNSNVLSINDNVDSSGFNRLYLGGGNGARQVEVAKNAEISGTYANGTGGAFAGTAQDYRSGGLRNMYTITVNEFARVPAPFPYAANGSVLLVYTPA